MKKYVCTVCGYVYDEAKGIPEAGVAPGTKWEDLGEGWVCPLCGAARAEFKAAGDAPKSAPPNIQYTPHEERELSPLELSALCSNLSRGCEKQYMTEETAAFSRLADYFRAAAPPQKDAGFDRLFKLIEKDLEGGIPGAQAAASAAKDRGALRALVWNEKATRILRSLLVRYEKEGEALLQNTGVYVCTICGFIYLGDRPPEICPVCKVPAWKFEKVEESA